MSSHFSTTVPLQNIHHMTHVWCSLPLTLSRPLNFYFKSACWMQLACSFNTIKHNHSVKICGFELIFKNSNEYWDLNNTKYKKIRNFIKLNKSRLWCERELILEVSLGNSCVPQKSIAAHSGARINPQLERRRIRRCGDHGISFVYSDLPRISPGLNTNLKIFVQRCR